MYGTTQENAARSVGVIPPRAIRRITPKKGLDFFRKNNYNKGTKDKEKEIFKK